MSTQGRTSRRTLLMAAAATTLTAGSTTGCSQVVTKLAPLVASEAARALGMKIGESAAEQVPKGVASAASALTSRLGVDSTTVVNYAFVAGHAGLSALVAGAGKIDRVHASHDNGGGTIVSCPALVSLGLMKFAQWHTKQYGTSQSALREGPLLHIERLGYADSEATVGNAHVYMLEMQDGQTIQITWEPTKTVGQLSTLYVRRGIYKGGSGPDWREYTDVSFKYNEIFSAT